MSSQVPQQPALQVDRLCVDFGEVRVVEDVAFHVNPGETLALVGESGAGKSVTLMSILGLLGASRTMVVGGQAEFMGIDLLHAPRDVLRAVRGGPIGFIFQDPMTALNPVAKVGRQITEAMMLHQPDYNARNAERRAVELLTQLGVPDAAGAAGRYPHQLSGGMRQRVVIAIALANSPSLLLADEPTTALDTTMQANVLRIFRDANADGKAIVLVTHDFGVVAEVAHRVAVMYGGRIVETGSVEEVFSDPRHPYTRGLLESRPRLDMAHSVASIPGAPPNPAELPDGCAFQPRCSVGAEAARCREEVPLLRDGTGSGSVACHFDLDPWEYLG